MGFLNDVATLIKAGYSKEDVKELYALEKQSEPAASPLPGEPAGEPLKDVQPPKKETEQATMPSESPKADKSGETVPKASTQPADEPDYKALYEAEKEKVKDLQNKNTNADISQNNGNYEAELLETIRDFC